MNHLGDVVLGTYILDFTLSAPNADGTTTYSIRSGIPEKVMTSLLEILPAIPLAEWNSPNALVDKRPQEWSVPIPFETKRLEKMWLPDIEEALQEMKNRRQPVCVQGPIGSSDALIKNPERLLNLLPANRNLCAVEMEAAGVLSVMSERHIPFLVVRGLSDVVGIKRLAVWTPYACATAAAYLMALLQNADVDRLIHPSEPHSPEERGADSGVRRDPPYLVSSLNELKKSMDEECLSRSLVPLRFENQPDAINEHLRPRFRLVPPQVVGAEPPTKIPNNGTTPSVEFTTFEEAFAFPAFRHRLLLLGQPGAGKTTTFFLLTATAAQNRLNSIEAPIPIPARLQEWDSQTSLKDWLKQREVECYGELRSFRCDTPLLAGRP